MNFMKIGSVKGIETKALKFLFFLYSALNT